MAVDVRIDCIRKPDRMNPHRHITHVGGPNPNGSGRWFLTEEDAIAGMDRGDWSFYVHAGGRTVRVMVQKSAQGHRYLKTVDDQYRPDNLLALPECS